MGGKCVKCDSTANLEIDHKDPKTMKYRLTGRFLTRRAEVVQAELKKCQLLCRKCHWDKTAKERGLKRSEHPSVSAYRNYGCRCPGCRIANAEYQRKLYARRRLQEAIMVS